MKWNTTQYQNNWFIGYDDSVRVVTQTNEYKVYHTGLGYVLRMEHTNVCRLFMTMSECMRFVENAEITRNLEYQ